MSKELAQHLAAYGRNGDSTLVHMHPDEVRGLAALGHLYGKNLTINPDTGLPEAFGLKEILLGLGVGITTALTGGAAAFAWGPLMGALTAGAVGAGLGAGSAAIQGKDVGKGALFGGIGGLTSGALNALGSTAGSALAQGAAETAGSTAANAAGSTAGSALTNAAGSTAGSTATNAAGSTLAKAGADVTAQAAQAAGSGAVDVLPAGISMGAPGAGEAARSIATQEALKNAAAQGASGMGQGTGIATQGAFDGAEAAKAVLATKNATMMGPPAPTAAPEFLKTAPNPYTSLSERSSEVAQGLRPQGAYKVDGPLDAFKASKDYLLDQGLGGTNAANATLQMGLMNYQANEEDMANQKRASQAMDNEYAGQYNQAANKFGIKNRLTPGQMSAVLKGGTNIMPMMAAGGTVPEVAGIPTISQGYFNQQPITDNYYPQALIPQAQPMQSTTPIRHDPIGHLAQGGMAYDAAASYAYGGPVGYGYAQGGETEHGSQGLLDGPGDGQSDGIAGLIQGAKGTEPVRLADGEFVVPADVVSALGSGSTKAGATALYAMLDRVRKQAYGHTNQANPVNTAQVMPA